MFEGRPVEPIRGLFAPMRFDVRIGRWCVDWTCLRYHAKDAREEFAKYWPGGWADALKRGWRIRRADVIGHQEENTRA